MTSHTLQPPARDRRRYLQAPFPYQLGPVGARKVLDDIQAAVITKPGAGEAPIIVPAEAADVPVRVIKPAHAETLPAVLHGHGGGWILGHAGTHDRHARALAAGINGALARYRHHMRASAVRRPDCHPPVAPGSAGRVAER